MRLSRERTDTLFQLHAKRQGLKIRELVRLGDFTYHIRMMVEDKKGNEHEETFKALVLTSSWDYWEYRLSFSAPAVSLIICSKHDSCLPVRVLEVGNTGYNFAPRELPEDAPVPGGTRTKRTARFFLGALLSGEQQAFNALKNMHPSSQKRYRYRMEQLLTEKRVGHQLFVVPVLQSA